MSQTFVPKNLVRWYGGESGESVGIVVAVAGGHMTVRFDGEAQVRKFGHPSSTVERLQLAVGQHVRLTSPGDSGPQEGVVQVAFPYKGRLLYKVGLANGQTPTVGEEGLRPVLLTDPIDRLRAGELHSAKLTNLRLGAHRLRNAYQHDQLSTLSNSRVELKPHQVGVLHRVISAYPHRFILADEVGLGKTIEAGLLVRELLARGVVKRILILAPSGLVGQWQQELKSKFNLTFAQYTSSSLKWIQEDKPDENPWTIRDLVIASTSFASWKEERWEEVASAGWDMVIVDEAHHVRRKYDGRNKSSPTRLYRFLQRLSDPDLTQGQAMLFLTATPMQLHRFELYSLIELLDPALFPTFADFEGQAEEVRGLNRTVEDVKQWPNLDPAARSATAEAVAGRLDVQDADVRARLEGSRDSVIEDLESKHRLSQVMVRNRKSVVGGFMPRKAAIWEVVPTEREVAALAVLEKYLRTGFARSKETQNNALGFLMSTFGKLSASSSRALKGSVERRIEKLEAITESDHKAAIVDAASLEEMPTADVLDALLAERADLDWQEVRELEEIVSLLEGDDVDSKGRVLIDRLEEFASTTEDPKAIVFTQFRDTQDYIEELLRDRWDVHIFHGGLKPHEKDEAVARFRDGRGRQILVSTEAGGEGRNFQYCSVLINYDLPWNPMRVEQRIGRIDRIGQKHPVKIFNLATRGTIEERVVEVLTHRIGVFTETIGGLDPILGDVEADITKTFLAAENERDRAATAVGAALESKIAEARAAEVKLADLIMDTRSYRKEEVERLLDRPASVRPDDLRSFVLGALTELAVKIEKAEIQKGVYTLTLGSKFEQAFPEEVAAGTRRLVTFDVSVALELEEVEFLAFGHPIVDGLVDRMADARAGGITSYRTILTDERQGARGWFFVYELEFRGLASNGRLLPIFVHEDGTVDDELASWLLDRAMTGRAEETRGFELPARGESFDRMVESVETRVIGSLFEEQTGLEALNTERLATERSKQERFFDYREQAAADKLAATERTVAALASSPEDSSRKILPVWRKNAEQARAGVEAVGVERAKRLADLEGREHVTAQHELLSASYVVIGSDPAALLARVSEALTPSTYDAFLRVCVPTTTAELTTALPVLEKRRADLVALSKRQPFDATLASAIADALVAALSEVARFGPGELRLLNGAVRYFLLLEDDDHDLKTPNGFEDDRVVLNIVLDAIGLGAHAVRSARPSAPAAPCELQQRRSAGHEAERDAP